MAAEEKPALILTDKEEKLVLMIRKLGFGEINIYVADGQPVRAEEIKKSVKL
ncbi:MAG: DUF2292 domain-containing protein [Clostridiales bacterium]|nr:DUF2292 domain-containing protein [Clostridiales bacterium]